MAAERLNKLADRARRAWLDPLERWQLARPGRLLLLTALSVVAALGLASRLQLDTSLGELLPENKKSVIVAEQVNARLPAASTLSVVAKGSDNEGLERFVDALTVELAKIGPPLVGRVDAGVQDAQHFIDDHRFLYAPLELVRQVHDEILERYEWEVGKRTGALLDEDEEDAPPPLTEESIRQRLEERANKSSAVAKAKKRYPDGYYLDEGKHLAVVLVRTPIGSADIERSGELQRRVREAVERVGPARYDSAITVGLGGNLLTSAETRAQIEGDLQHVGLWGVSLILAVVLLYYLRLRTLIAMVLAVGTGTSWTFAVAYLAIGHLNSSTGFLFSIVVGNGINFGIIFMARYLEARREADAPGAVRIARNETWLATLTASAAATCAYGSLAVTDFRGFKHFGIIGGSGMLLCWLATYLVLPPLLLLFERVAPIAPTGGRLARFRGLYGRPFALLGGRYPRAVTLIVTAVTCAAGLLSYRYLAAGPIEYNMNNIDNELREEPTEARRLSRVVDDIVGRQGVDGLALATDRLGQVKPLQAALEQRRDAAPAGKKPFKSVVTIYSLLPDRQADKLRLVREARDTLAHAHTQGYLDDEQWRRVNDLLPAARLHTIGIDDLPEPMARPFTEVDGSRGKLVYVTPAAGRSVWDGHYLVDWAAAIRETKLPDGSVVYGSGRSVIFADMILAVKEDAPKAIVASLLSTLFIVALAFRGSRLSLMVVASVLAGLAWTIATLAIYDSEWPWGPSGHLHIEGLRLNFLNFVALPITLGVGADYAVNVMKRYQHAKGDIRRVVVETGGAVVLCSLTTMLGYSALTLSVNRAVQSFGVAAAAGEVGCVIAGVLGLPALLLWRARRRASMGGDGGGGEGGGTPADDRASAAPPSTG